MNHSTALGTRTQSFGENSLTTSGETHTAALAAAAQASVQARFIVAMQRPRSWDDVRVRVLQECARPGFAAVARYNKPVGKGIRGPSIRFAEACFRYAQNMDAPITTTFEDAFKRILHVQLIDLETNASYSADITIEKIVERRDRKDRDVLGERKNKNGDTVYIVSATEDELLNKQNALVSKSLRTLILRMIPGDIIDEGQRACIDTLANEDAKDPAAAKKKLIDSYADIGIMPKDLEQLVGHSLNMLQPAELSEMREAYATVRDGESTWRAILEAKYPPAETQSSGGGSLHDLEAKLRGHQKPEISNAVTGGSGPMASGPVDGREGKPEDVGTAGSTASADAPTTPARDRKPKATPVAHGVPRAAQPQQTTVGEFPGDPPPTPATSAATAAASVPAPMSETDRQRGLIAAWPHPLGHAVVHKDSRTQVAVNTTTASTPRIFGDRAVIELHDGQGGRIMAALEDVTPWGGNRG